MKSLRSSRFETDRHGQFVNSKCQCNPADSTRIHKLCRVSVPMTAKKVYKRYEKFRKVVNTVFKPVQFKGPLKDMSHDCVEIYFYCSRCQEEVSWTLELNKKGKFFKKKYYANKLSILDTFNPSCLTIEDVKNSFELISSRYNLVSHNCSHFAFQLFKKLIEFG